MTPEISGSTRLAGVIGWPLEHTLSPAMHNAAYRNLGLDWVYVPMPVKHEGDLASVLGAVRVLPFVGLNVTMPYKRAVTQLCDEVDELAHVAQAVNTVVCSSGRLLGFNTDGPGLIEALSSDLGFDPSGRNVVLLGAGGAASGALVALAHAGADVVTVINRDVARAQALVARVSARFPEARLSASPYGEDAQPLVEGAHLVVNATSVGMSETDPSPIPGSWLRSGQVVADMVYRAQPTAFVMAAREAGATACDGLGMLVSQGAIAADLWRGSGKEPTPRDVMCAAAETELGRHGRG